MTGLH